MSISCIFSSQKFIRFIASIVSHWSVTSYVSSWRFFKVLKCYLGSMGARSEIMDPASSYPFHGCFYQWDHSSSPQSCQLVFLIDHEIFRKRLKYKKATTERCLSSLRSCYTEVFKLPSKSTNSFLSAMRSSSEHFWIVCGHYFFVLANWSELSRSFSKSTSWLFNLPANEVEIGSFLLPAAYAGTFLCRSHEFSSSICCFKDISVHCILNIIINFSDPEYSVVHSNWNLASDLHLSRNIASLTQYIEVGNSHWSPWIFAGCSPSTTLLYYTL